MTPIFLQHSSDWDSPIFKVLSYNDSGDSTAHQAGVVIPKDLRKFFPFLPENTSPGNPTTDRYIHAELFVENRHVGTVRTRYQNQTWGNTRKPETRLTDQLGPLRNHAKGGDVLIIQRRKDDLAHYRLILVRRTTEDFNIASKLIGPRRWGPLMDTSPLAQSDLDSAIASEKERETTPFQLFSQERGKATPATRQARSLVFRKNVVTEYGSTCAFCGEAMRSPKGAFGLDAAHIVPVAFLGPDDTRNGLSLCKNHHWAFDKGLVGVDKDRKIIIPATVSCIPENHQLLLLSGSMIREAKAPEMRAHEEALRWHRENIFLGPDIQR